jgi:FAD/FMN-containing dehydrogenase
VPGAPPQSFIADLRRIVGAEHVLEGDLTSGYAVDWTGRFRGRTPAVLRPGSTAEVAAVVAACAEAGVAVVPQGGNTGMVGGGVPLDDEVVVSLRRLQAVGPIDVPAAQVTAGAGVTLAVLHEAAGRAGMRYAVDLGARDTATVGGTVATNAGGIHVLRFGPTRAQLRGVEAVLADGSVVSHLGGLLKDNTGYDLAGLLCGSEGTLGIVTAARLRLLPAPAHTVVALVGFASFAEAVETAIVLRTEVESLEAVEGWFAAGQHLVQEQLGLPPPFPEPAAAYLLVEAAGRADPSAQLATALDRSPAVQVAVATDPARRASLWRHRERHTEAIGHLGVPHKLDVTVPPGLLVRFAEEVCPAVADLAPDARCWLFGHVLDGNLHVNVTGVAPDDDRVDEVVLRLVADLGGSISAEHGIGRAKRGFLHLARSEAEIAAFRAIKSALDPRGILNPGVLVPPR